MRAPQHDDSLGPCPWCSSEKHRVHDEGSEGDRTERDFWAQCWECNACSPSYPTIDALRDGWAEARRGAAPSSTVMQVAQGMRAALESHANLGSYRRQQEVPLATVGQLREWAELLEGAAAPPEVWVGPFANVTKVWATRQAYLDAVNADLPDETDPRVFAPRPVPVITGETEDHDRS